MSHRSATVLVFAVGMAGGASAQNVPDARGAELGGGTVPPASVVLWDQSAFDANLQQGIDQDFPDYPSFSSFMVDDFATAGQTWNVKSITTYYTKGYGTWSNAINSAKLQVYPKAGALPANVVDIAPEYTVAITLTDGGTYWIATADTSGIAELQGINGAYWIGLTPTADYTTYGQEYHEQLAVSYGAEAAWRNPGGGFGNAQDWLGVDGILGRVADMAFKLEGDSAGGGSTWYADADGDSYGDPSVSLQDPNQPPGYVASAGDCDDGNAAIHPGATETCNNLDDDCDGQTDEGAGSTWYADADGDTYGDSANSLIACSQPNGYIAIAGDCNDANASVHPGATEVCNGLDDDCDGQADEGVSSTWYADADGDGYGDPASATVACSQPNGYIAIAGDCNDANAAVNPGATEICNGQDDDCDGQTDEVAGSSILWDQSAYDTNIPALIDQDFTDYPASSTFMVDDFSTGNQTWNITSITTYYTKGLGGPWDTGITTGRLQVYKKTGTLPDDAADVPPEYPVVITLTDGGGYWIVRANTCGIAELQGISGDYWIGLTVRTDAITHGQEYHYLLPSFHGDKAAIRNVGGGMGNGTTWAGLASFNSIPAEMAFKLEGDSASSTWYADADGDAYGDPAVSLQNPSPPPGYVATAGDCNDADPSIHPGAPELCDAIDNDCNGTIDDGLQVQAWYADSDGDGWGDPGNTIMACAQPPGYIPAAPNTDCDDANPLVNPGMTEVCNNGLDDDCDGLVDVGGGSNWYADNDGDGWGDAANSIFDCTPPPGYIAQAGDCDDANAAVYPGATELCDNLDNDCDGQTDEGLGTTWYADGDADGYGDAGATIVACAQPGGYVATAGDCDDTDAAVNPGATEVCGNNIDDNCDGQVDENCCGVAFQGAQAYGVDWNPRAIAEADFNNDGILDLVTTNTGAHTASVLLGIGDGTFHSAVNYATGVVPAAVVTGDFNRDARADLAVANANSGSVSVLLGNGNGTFAPANNYAVGSSPVSIGASDFNADGNLDLAVANQSSNTVSILLGIGNGSFPAPVDYAAAGAPVAIALADFNHDSRVDLAVSNYASGSVSIFLGNPDGTFQSPSTAPAGGSPLFIAAADLDADGWSDLVVGNYSPSTGLSVLLANPNGTFQSPVAYGGGPYTTAVGVTDFDGNGSVDLYYVNQGGSTVAVRLGNGDGTFGSAVSLPVPTNCIGGIAGDFDGDGRPDLAIPSWGSSNVSIFLNSSPGSPWYADLDADGYGDPGNVKVSCTQPPNYIVSAGDCDDADAAVHPGAPEICDGKDNDCDGIPDDGLALSTWYADADGDSYGDAANSIQACSQPSGYIATAGDCDDTNAAINPNATETCDGLDNNCNGQTDEGLGTTWYADGDSDGYGDAGHSTVACSQPNGYVGTAGDCDDTTATVYPGATELCDGLDNDCDGQTDEGLGTTWYADADADGYGDAGATIVACAQPGGYVAVAGDCDDADVGVNPGATEVCGNNIDDNCNGQTDEGCCPLTFQPVNELNSGALARGVRTHDFDRDGNPDLVVVGMSTDSASVWLGNGDGTFKAPVGYALGVDPVAVALGDLDGDGASDVVSANYTSNNVSVLLGKTDGTFQAKSSAGVGTSPFSIALGDFDGDGRLDAAVANSVSNNVSVLLGKGDGTFKTAVNYPVGTLPWSVARDDFNNDGKLDLVVANLSSDTVSILLGNGNGTFQAAVGYAVTDPTSVCASDLDGDGKPDLIVTNEVPDTVSILRGNANGTFQTAVTYPCGPRPYTAAVGDFNGDGRSDLAVSNYFSSSISILLGAANGTFQSPSTFAFSGGAFSLTLGDFNRDGRADLASANFANNTKTLSILLNSSPGTTWYPDLDADGYGDASRPRIACLQPPGYLASAGDCDDADAAIHPGAPEICDGKDNDCNGTPDDGLTLSTWYADADGDSFGDAANSLQACSQPSGYIATAGDCDDTNAAVNPSATETCDGLDNNCNGQTDEGLGTTWYADGDSDGYGDATHQLIACSLPSGYVAQAGDCDDTNATVYPGATELCDGLDNDCDGQTDEGLGTTWYADTDADGYGNAGATIVACAQPGGYVAVAGDCDDGNAAIHPGATEVCDNAIDDNCDGKVDEGCCPVSLQGPVAYAVELNPYAVASGDFNRDGRPDLVIGNYSSTLVSVLLAKPDGTFKPRVNYAAANNPASVAVGDFDGDGGADLAAANFGSASVSILIGKPDGTFKTRVNYGTGANPWSVAIGDFNRDGRLDLAVANYSGATVSILLGKGDGTFLPKSDFVTGTNPSSLVVGDFDGDGGPDVVTANTGGANISILLGNPDGTLLAPSNFAVGTSPVSVAMGDLDADGGLDLAVANASGNSVSILLGNANGTFKTRVNYTAGSIPRSVAVADFDGDGRLDVAVANGSSNDVSILRGKPGGTLRAAVSFAAGTSPYALVPADLNRDGRPDLATANYLGKDASVLFNDGGRWFWYPDADADGFGDAGAPSIQDCLQPSGYVASGGDCDDADPAIHPGATEFCDGKDNDCNGTPDDGLTISTWYADADGDSFGDAANSIQACSQPNGYVAIAGDCDDTNAAVNPSASETCDGLDNNCNGQTDEGLGQTWYADADGDAYGDAAHTLFGCAQPNGYVAQAGDCDDLDPAVHPGATEVCNGLDDDCDGTPDDGLPFNTWYADGDGDGFGDPGTAYTDCFQPNGYVAQAGDCDDTDPAVNPGAFEVCGDGIDNNCDGQVDEGCCPLSFQARKLATAGSGPQGVAVADFNGDGRLDLVTANGNASNVSILLGQGDGTFMTGSYKVGAGLYPTQPVAVAVGDFNSDGRPDVAAVNKATDDVAVLLGLGDGTFKPRSNYPVGSVPSSVAVGDFDADGNPDLVVANSYSNSVSILLGKPDGTFVFKINCAVGSYPVSVAIGDFNGDGALDLAVANTGSNEVSILQGNGNGTFQSKPSCPLSGGAKSLALGDVNADGHLDMAVTNGGYVSVLLGNPNGSFQAAANYPGNYPVAVAMGEFDGDGHPDLAVSSSGAAIFSVFLGKPGGTFKPRVDFADFLAASAAVGDFDRDGRSDLALSYPSSNKVSVRLNDGGTWLWYADADADGYGDAGGVPIRACNPPQGRVATGRDCDDGNPTIHPLAREVCDGLDNDCNGLADEFGDPIVTQDPASQSANLGAPVQFTVSDLGGTTYQWRRNGIPIVGATAKTYNISGVQESDAGLYSVIVYNNCGQATSANAALTVQPVSPSNLSGVEAPKGKVSLTWTDNSGLETAFEVWRAAYSGGNWGTPTLVATLAPNTTSYSQSPGVGVWRYRIRAVNGNLNSAWTPFEAIRPAAPSGLTAQKIQIGKAKLLWTDNSNFETTFTIERQKFNGFTWGSSVTLPSQGANTTTYTDSPGSGKYRYRIRATNAAGNSTWAGWVSVNL